MIHKNKSMMQCLTVVFSTAFILISIFANCLHSHNQGECTSFKSFCAIEKQAAGIISESGEHNDCEGDCAACSFLSSAQNAFFDNINLPEKQESRQYSIAEIKFLHNKICIEYLPRAPPYFIA